MVGRVQVTVCHLFVSPGHNYFGHHGRGSGCHPVVALERCRCRAGRGIEGDRFFDYKPDYNGQVTFFDAAVVDALRSRFSRPDLSAGAVRRNVVLAGIHLPDLVGQTFRVGEVTFAGICEAKPCYWMDEAVAPGAAAWLAGRGGLRAKILADGELVVGATTWERVAGQLALPLAER